MMKKLTLRDWLIGSFVIGLLLIVAYIWLSPAGVQQAPDLKVSVFNSERTIDLKQLKGRPVLVTFWATSCSGCIKEMPHLIELYKELAPKGLEIIGIAMSYDRPDHILEMQKRKEIPYPIVYDGINEASRAFGGIRLTPTTFLINPKGQIVRQKLGEMDMELLHAQILTMLNTSKKSS
ncbi:MAG: TlpA disulfide reductase family protein [Thioalkalispiraceae bacterium]|jgi:peroxiredoxin